MKSNSPSHFSLPQSILNEFKVSPFELTHSPTSWVGHDAIACSFQSLGLYKWDKAMHFLFSRSLVERDSIPNTCSILTFSLVLLLACTGLHLMYIIPIHRETIICWHAVCPYAQAHKIRQPAIGILLCLLTYASRKAVGLHSPVVWSGLSRQILSPFHQNLSAN